MLRLVLGWVRGLVIGLGVVVGSCGIVFFW